MYSILLFRKRSMSATTLTIWLNAIRPHTLPLAISCILTGSGLAFHQGQFSLTLLILALITSLLLQILSNLANDFGDTNKGTDNSKRIGPKRTMQQGLISQNAMIKAISFNILLILIFGTGLIFLALENLQDIISFMLIGFLAILAAIFYTMGKKPYGYYGLGDLSVLIFFGWLAVGGSYYLYTGNLSLSIFLPATATGLLSVGVLNINNLRDIENDKACNKNTLVVRFGEQGGRIYHQLLLSLSFGLLILYTLLNNTAIQYWLFLLCLPLAIKHGRAIWLTKSGEDVKPLMPEMVKLTILVNSLFVFPYFF